MDHSEQHSSPESERLKAIFREHDTDHDGYLQDVELRMLIKEKLHADIPTGVEKQIIKEWDCNGDNKLDFPEFRNLSTRERIQDLYRMYCKAIVPQRSTGGSHQTDGEIKVTCYPPVMVLTFSILQIIFFVIDVVRTQSARSIGPLATLFIYNPEYRQEAWRFLTYMFVHIDSWHLTMNLLVQIFLGSALEPIHGSWRVAVVYLSGIMAGSMGSSLLAPRDYLAGASGGVYSLLTAHFATIVMNWKQMKNAPIQLLFFVIYCICDVLKTIFYNVLNPRFDNSSLTAHICGALAGFLVGIAVLRNIKIESWERKLWWCAVTTYFILMIGGVMFHLLHPAYFSLH